MRSKGQPWIVLTQQLDPHNQFEGDGIDQARRIHIEHDYLYNMRRILWLSEKQQSHLYYDTRIFFVYSSTQILHRTFGTILFRKKL